MCMHIIRHLIEAARAETLPEVNKNPKFISAMKDGGGLESTVYDAMSIFNILPRVLVSAAGVTVILDLIVQEGSGGEAASTTTPATPQQDKPTKSCDECGKTGHLRLCSACRTVSYCSVECQKKDWPVHKTSCKKK